MFKSKIVQRIGVVLAVVLVSLGAGATAASASNPVIDNCPAGDRVCTYMLGHGAGARYDYSYWLNHCYNIGGAWNDNIHSLWNASHSHNVIFYADAGCANTFATWEYWPQRGEENYASNFSSLMWTQ